MTEHKRTDGNATARWLHLSDLHVGMRNQNQLWPRFRTIFQKDLQDLLQRTGPVDLLVFSGDLVQRGEKSEFDQFDIVLEEILGWIAEAQPRPKVLTVPGNHDLARPSNLAPELIALKQFWSNSELRSKFWDREGASYRAFLANVFKNYTEWRDNAIERGVHLRPDSLGILPGDSSYSIETKSGSLGVIALNSTWLQLAEGDYKGHLHVDVQQILSVTDSNPDGWTKSNQFNLLVTHQPTNWLHPNRPSTWENDINPPGRFDAHLFGHMHQPDATTIQHGGSLNRLSMQAASLFGLEKIGDGDFERIQGYSVNEIKASQSTRQITSWPRRRITTTSGKDKIDRDTEQDLDEGTGSFTVNFGNYTPQNIDKCDTDLNISFANTIELDQPIQFDPSTARFIIGDARAHRNVRRIEQETCIHALSTNRLVWIAADWGMGLDGFISSIIEQLGVPNDCIFSIDVSEYRDRASFFDSIKTRLGASFQEVCEAIGNAGQSILVLDDFDLVAHPELQPDIEALGSTITDFSTQTCVVIRSRRPPRESAFKIVQLGPLDEPDVATYATESENGASRYGKPDAALKLFRHTDGVPTRIDAALRDLEIVSLGDLISSNPDFGHTGNSPTAAPQALVTSVQELKQSQDRAEQRAYELLLALAALPQGEQLTRLKRFLGVHPIGAMHARALLERGLINTVGLTTLDGDTDSTDKALVVPRPVRDFVRETMSQDIASSTDMKMLNLYFGDDWATGSIRNSPTGKRVRAAFCAGYEIQNACTLVLRHTRRSLDSGTRIEIECSIRLALAFIDALVEGDHFRSVVSLCEDMRQLLTDCEGFEKDLTKLNYEYARSLRMSGNVQDALDIFLSLNENHLDKSDRQQAALSLALCYERLDDGRQAATAAQRGIAINKKSNTALHCKVVIAEQIDNDADRESELRELLRQAEKKEAHTLVSNIRLDLARSRLLPKEEARNFLRETIAYSKSNGDFYNSARAVVELANLPDADRTMTEDEKIRLIETYHFLYNERLFNLFDRCHDALWRVFERAGDRANLLNLFRRSSFIWRLNGREHNEAKYLTSLRKIVRDVIAMGITNANRDGAYFIVRITVVTGTALQDLAQEGIKQDNQLLVSEQ